MNSLRIDSTSADLAPKLALARSHRRRRGRGVAMVEGAVVFPIMAMFIFMLEMVHHSSDAYITTGHVAEERAWSSATIGSFIGKCPAGRDDTSYKPKYFKMDAIGGGSGPDQVGSSPAADKSGTSGANIPGPSGGWFMQHDSAVAAVSVKRGGRSYEKNASSVSKVFCNQPWAGGVIDIIKNAFKH